MSSQRYVCTLIYKCNVIYIYIYIYVHTHISHYELTAKVQDSSRKSLDEVGDAMAAASLAADADVERFRIYCVYIYIYTYTCLYVGFSCSTLLDCFRHPRSCHPFTRSMLSGFDFVGLLRLQAVVRRGRISISGRARCLRRAKRM